MRGRLNVLANVSRQALPSLFCQFNTLEPSDEGSGDVKYHLGVCINRLNRQSGKDVRLAICANPSHLEAVNPVVAGKIKAEMFYAGDEGGERTLGITMHGDAAFAGQGVVFETMNLTGLPAYTTHGIIHVVVNNQVGFTTDPRFSRSSPYCTDVARVVGAPIFHVNGDDPEAVMHVCNVAADWRQRFKRDVVIDIVCYRRHGHNELDEPMFTQPLMYQTIKTHTNTLESYKVSLPLLTACSCLLTALLLFQEQIMREGVATEQYVKDELAKYGQILEDSYILAQKETSVRNRDWLDSPWDGPPFTMPSWPALSRRPKDIVDFFKSRDPLNIPGTGVDAEVIQHIGDKFSGVEEGFNLHNGLKRILKGRAKMVNEEQVCFLLSIPSCSLREAGALRWRTGRLVRPSPLGPCSRKASTSASPARTSSGAPSGCLAFLYLFPPSAAPGDLQPSAPRPARPEGRPADVQRPSAPVPGPGSLHRLQLHALGVRRPRIRGPLPPPADRRTGAAE